MSKRATASKADQLRAMREAEARAAEQRAREAKAAPLTRAEQMKLVDCEQNIAAGIETFVLVGASLATIREQRLYRDQYPTFEAYVAGRWGFTDRRARQLIGASEVVQSLGETGTSGSGPVTERQARELAAVPPESRVEVMEHAAEIAAEDPKAKGRTQTRHIREAARPHKPKKPTPPEHEGGGDHEPGPSTSEEERAVVTVPGVALEDHGSDSKASTASDQEGSTPSARNQPSEAEAANPSPAEPPSERDLPVKGAAQGEVPSVGEGAAESLGSHSEGRALRLLARVSSQPNVAREILFDVVDELGFGWFHVEELQERDHPTDRALSRKLATLLIAAGVER